MYTNNCEFISYIPTSSSPYSLLSPSPDILLRLMAYVVNLTLVMQLLFLVLAGGRCELKQPLIKTVVRRYKASPVKSAIHTKIQAYKINNLFSGKGRDQAFENVSGLIREFYDCAEIHKIKNSIWADPNVAKSPNTSGTRDASTTSG